jgi:hypothetical protein
VETPDTAKEVPTDLRASARPYQDFVLDILARSERVCQFNPFV